MYTIVSYTTDSTRLGTASNITTSNEEIHVLHIETTQLEYYDQILHQRMLVNLSQISVARVKVLDPSVLSLLLEGYRSRLCWDSISSLPHGRFHYY